MIGLTLDQMISEIRMSAKLPDTDEMTNHIVIQINQRLRHYTAMNQYSELLVLQETLNIGADAQAVYALPATLQHLRSVYFNDATLELTSNQPNSFFRRINSLTSSGPRSVTRAGAQIQLSPASEIKTTDTMLLDYYAYPPLVTDLTATFPIPILSDVIVNAVAARICQFTDSKMFEYLKLAEKEAYRQTRNQTSIV